MKSNVHFFWNFSSKVLSTEFQKHGLVYWGRNFECTEPNGSAKFFKLNTLHPNQTNNATSYQIKNNDSCTTYSLLPLDNLTPMYKYSTCKAVKFNHKIYEDSICTKNCQFSVSSVFHDRDYDCLKRNEQRTATTVKS